jgi:hypothetical protein
VAAHRSDLLEVAITAPGADSTNGIACAVVFPDLGAMNATTVSSQDAYTAGPGVARWPGRISRPSASPASAGCTVRGSAAVRERRSPIAARAAGRRVSARIRGLRASAATGSPGDRPAARDQPPGHGGEGGDAADQDDCGNGHRDRGGVRPGTIGAAVQDITGEFCSERLCGAAGDSSGDLGCGPDQPGQRDQAPAAGEHGPARGGPARRGRWPRPQSPAHRRPPAWSPWYPWECRPGTSGSNASSTRPRPAVETSAPWVCPSATPPDTLLRRTASPSPARATLGDGMVAEQTPGGAP